MRSDFQLVALPRESFVHLFTMTDAELAACGARRFVVDKKPGFPCRVSLVDSEIGETVILTPFQHHDVESPYQSGGPVFVREAAQTAKLEPNHIPMMFHHRLLSVRAYDEAAMMIGSKVIEGRDLEEAISRLFADRDIAYLHLHNAAPGCFNCRVERA
jgi:hypothetical protein